MSKVRRASHAGSWYSDRGDELKSQLSNWLSKAPAGEGHARAIIAPHAGYYYCGSCAGHAYRQVDPTIIKRVFVLGPSHHLRLSGCALSSAERYETPLYDLNVDQNTYRELFGTGLFETMSMQTDEAEHSLEMHLPYIARVMESRQGQFSIVPVMIGSLTPDKEQMYGQLFAPYLADPENLFVISSDFCHWGKRFSYTYYDHSVGEIWQSIEKLDRMGMEKIEAMDPVAFTEYLKEFQNTICGRHPIGVLLHAVTFLRQTGNGHKISMNFLGYDQSSRCREMKDSSVSYASAALTIQ